MTTITNFVWDPVDDCVSHELDGTGAVKASYTNEPQPYGGVISQHRDGTTSTLHADPSWPVIKGARDVGKLGRLLNSDKQYTDGASCTPNSETWGQYRQISDIRLYCYKWNRSDPNDKRPNPS